MADPRIAKLEVVVDTARAVRELEELSRRFDVLKRLLELEGSMTALEGRIRQIESWKEGREDLERES